MARDEQLFATASLVKSWILIEQPGAWGPDALVDSGFPASAAGRLLQDAAQPGLRVLLIRRRTGEESPRTVFLAHSDAEGGTAIAISGTVADLLADLDLEGFAGGRLPDFGRPVEGPIYLVCTHGRHDICCADHGRPLFRATSAIRPDQTWEVSHIGGDRFAGNLLILPRGDYFGRLAPGDAPRVVAEYEAGRLDLIHHRGRSIHPRLVQAAEHFLRRSAYLPGFDDLALFDYVRIDHDHAEVVFQSRDQTTHEVQVAARSLSEPVYLTCRAEEAGRPVAYDLLSISSRGVSPRPAPR